MKRRWPMPADWPAAEGLRPAADGAGTGDAAAGSRHARESARLASFPALAAVEGRRAAEASVPPGSRYGTRSSSAAARWNAGQFALIRRYWADIDAIQVRRMLAEITPDEARELSRRAALETRAELRLWVGMAGC